MTFNVYVIYDKVAKTVQSQLLVKQNDALLLRDVKTAKLGELIESNKEDFDIYCLGELDTEKPLIVGLDNARFVAHLEVIK